MKGVDLTLNKFLYRARYYSPELQRFISEDPIGLAGGINLYEYVHSNPVNFTDPLGLESFKDCGMRVYLREAGYLKGKHDKYQHCVVACRIKQECGSFTACAGSIWKEIKDIRRKGIGSIGDSLDDLDADGKGMKCADTNQNCYICCRYEGYGTGPGPR